MAEFIYLPGNGYSYTQYINPSTPWSSGSIVDVAANYNPNDLLEHVTVSVRNYAYDFYHATNPAGSGWSSYQSLTGSRCRYTVASELM